jgi:3D (Asp-Asp-Asp) domain-containing protein
MACIVDKAWSCGIAGVLLLMANSAASAGKCDLKQGISPQEGRAGPCSFDPQSKSFGGTSEQQAACLTREVKRLGDIGDETITPFLREVSGKPAPAIPAVQALLDARQINAVDVGGPLSRPITANYFIIHDTSTPNCSAVRPSTACPIRGEFPRDRDEASWSFNKNFGGHPKPFPDRLAHAFSNRTGASITEVDFAEHIATTKFELCVDRAAKTKLFVGIENIQPRIGSPSIPSNPNKVNDFEAPSPGFSAKQYERLALLYVVASARRGQWLIPAFHAVLDQFYADGHDDPQRFDMQAFSAEVEKLSDAVPAVTHASTVNRPRPQADGDIPKRAMGALRAATCGRIADHASGFAVGKTTKTTQYFTPLFRPGADGGLRTEDRRNCLEVEGSCIVGDFLYNAGGPNGQRFDRTKVKFIFGQGTGVSKFNRTNALVPCRTLAADGNHYKIGTVIYIPSFKGNICPQNGEPVDGCFIVGDTGSAIDGNGRFDIFTGECARYEGDHNTCRDSGNAGFDVPKDTEFRVVPRDTEFAQALRMEVDAFIENGWKSVP